MRIEIILPSVFGRFPLVGNPSGVGAFYFKWVVNYLIDKAYLLLLHVLSRLPLSRN